MKKLSKLLLTCVLVLSLMTGCVKYEAKMEVKENKSVTLEILYGVEVDESMFDDESEDDSYTDDTEEDENSVNPEDYKYLEDAGFKVEKFEETDKEGKTLSGVKISKTFKNIDDITSNEKVTVDFNAVLEEEKKDSLKDIKYFYKDGNKYVANFVFDFSTDDGMDYSSYQDMFDMVYTVKLPKEAVENNATKVSEDKLTYTWDLAYGKKNEVNYSFEMGGMDLTTILIIVAGVLVVAIVVVLLTSKKGGNKVAAPVAPVVPSVPAAPGMPDLLAPEPTTPVAPQAPVAPVPPVQAPVAPTPVVEPVVTPAAPVAPTPVVEPVAAPAEPVAPAPVAEPVVAPAAPVVEQPVNAFNTTPTVDTTNNQNM